jgi:hypothetical protein
MQHDVGGLMILVTRELGNRNSDAVERKRPLMQLQRVAICQNLIISL